MPGEMPLKIRFIDGHRLQTNRLGVPFKTQNPVDHQERITMGQNLHDIVCIHGPLPNRNVFHRHQRRLIRAIGLVQSFSKKEVQPVTRFCRQDMSPNRHWEKRQIPNDIENLVTNELVGITKRLLAHYRFTSDHDRVLQTSPLDEALCQKRLDLLVKYKRSCPSNLLGVIRSPDF